ncbi:DUF6329 domain-containing protein [Phascolarctobacterium faecium]|uniref:DUF6329 domain-containing protein n=1 Tax=Phascolarctobacterium faecium TaxID=33025 RepID=UPI003AB68A6B
MWYGNGVHHCLLIYDKQQGDGLLIESEGAPYVRYAQFIPNAKLLYENHMQNHLQELKFCCPLEITESRNVGMMSMRKSRPMRFLFMNRR